MLEDVWRNIPTCQEDRKIWWLFVNIQRKRIVVLRRWYSENRNKNRGDEITIRGKNGNYYIEPKYKYVKNLDKGLTYAITDEDAPYIKGMTFLVQKIGKTIDNVLFKWHCKYRVTEYDQRYIATRLIEFSKNEIVFYDEYAKKNIKIINEQLRSEIIKVIENDEGVNSIINRLENILSEYTMEVGGSLFRPGLWGEKLCVIPIKQ